MRKTDYIIAIGIVAVIIFGLMTFASLANAAQVTLQWDPNTPEVDGYNVYQRIIDDTEAIYDYSAPINGATLETGTQFTVTNLTPGQAYAFVVRAVKGDNQSGDSNEVQYTVPIVHPTVVFPKQVIDLEWDVDTKILSWNSSGNPEKFIVGLVDSNGVEQAFETTEKIYTLNSLSPGITYTAVVRAVIGENIGAASQAVQFTMPIQTTVRIYPKQVITLRIERGTE